MTPMAGTLATRGFTLEKYVEIEPRVSRSRIPRSLFRRTTTTGRSSSPIRIHRAFTGIHHPEFQHSPASNPLSADTIPTRRAQLNAQARQRNKSRCSHTHQRGNGSFQNRQWIVGNNHRFGVVFYRQHAAYIRTEFAFLRASPPNYRRPPRRRDSLPAKERIQDTAGNNYQPDLSCDVQHCTVTALLGRNAARRIAIQMAPSLFSAFFAGRALACPLRTDQHRIRHYYSYPAAQIRHTTGPPTLPIHAHQDGATPSGPTDLTSRHPLASPPEDPHPDGERFQAGRRHPTAAHTNRRT